MLRSRRSHTLALAGVVLLGGGVLSQAQTLDLKTGLWEMTSTTDMAGMPQIDTSKMTPEQRARVEAAMKGRMGGQSSTTKSCMTKEKLDKAGFVNTPQTSSCKNSIVSSSHSLIEVKVECPSPHQSTSTMRFEAVSRESMKGTIKINSADPAHPMTMNISLTGKWLGDDCGAVK